MCQMVPMRLYFAIYKAFQQLNKLAVITASTAQYFLDELPIVGQISLWRVATIIERFERSQRPTGTAHFEGRGIGWHSFGGRGMMFVDASPHLEFEGATILNCGSRPIAQCCFIV